MKNSKNKAIESKKRGTEYHLGKMDNGTHRVYDKATGAYETYFANKHHASSGLKYKNTDLEFASSSRNPNSLEKSLRRHVVRRSKPMIEK